MTKRPENEKQRRRAHRLKQLTKREAFEAAKPKPRKDAAVLMYKNTPLEGTESSPLTDPLWLTDQQFEERRRVMREVEAFENNTAGCGLFDFYVNLGGEQHHASDFVVWQSKIAHELLNRGVDVRTISATVYRSIDWVDDLANRYRIG